MLGELKTMTQSGGYLNKTNSTTRDIVPDYDIVRQFMACLCGEETPATFQVFSDSKGGSVIPLVLHGKFEDHFDKLVDINRQGAGIFTTINETDLKGRASKNIVRVRALMADLDSSPLQPVLEAGVKPHIVNETSRDRYQCFWLVSDCELEQFTSIQKALAKKFEGDPSVADLPHCCRIPGFYHNKGEPVMSRIFSIAEDLTPYRLDEVVTGLDLHIGQAPVTDEAQDHIASQDILAALRANEDGDASLFIRVAGDEYCFDRAAEQWYRWNEHYWIEDRLGTVVEGIEGVLDLYHMEVVRQNRLELEATRAGDDKKPRSHKEKAAELLSRIKGLRSRYRKENVLWRAGHGENSLAITGNEWDSDPWLLGCLNGVIDLRNGSFRPGCQSDFIKTVAPVEWAGLDADCPTFERFLSEILVDDTFNPDTEMVSFFQRLLGCALAGQVKEHIFPILWGPRGRNGKGTLCNLLKLVLGDYVGAIQTETLMQSKHSGNPGGPRSDLVSLRAMRIVWASETDGWHRLSPSKVKLLSGGDIIRARAPHAKCDIEFAPTHQVLFLTNPKPRIMAGPSDPIWERILLIPFHVSYVTTPNEPWQRKADVFLSDRLGQENNGILSWLVRGTLEWLEKGLNPPARVTGATAEYREEENVLGAFVADATEQWNGGKIKAHDLYLAFRKWAESGYSRVMSETEFGREMPLIIPRKKEGRNNTYQGVRLNTLGETLLTTAKEDLEKGKTTRS